ASRHYTSSCPVLYSVLSAPIADTVFFLFFFHGDGHHRALHSFPTRRSSDLGLSAESEPSIEDLAGEWVFSRALFGARAGRRPIRSEEHTSELQSRGHLVCRLLLEKKKRNRSTLLRSGTLTSHALPRQARDR